MFFLDLFHFVLLDFSSILLSTLLLLLISFLFYLLLLLLLIFEQIIKKASLFLLLFLLYIFFRHTYLFPPVRRRLFLFDVNKCYLYCNVLFRSPESNRGVEGKSKCVWERETEREREKERESVTWRIPSQPRLNRQTNKQTRTYVLI